MKQSKTTSLARISSSNRTIDRLVKIQRVTQLTRLGSTMEPLESRTMMSAGSMVIQASAVTAGPIKGITVTPVVTPVVAPTGLTVTTQSRTQLLLAWTGNDSSAAGYYVLRSTDGRHFHRAATITSVDTTTFTDTGLTAGHVYKYVVEAYRGKTSSPASEVASGIALASAPLLTPTAVLATASSPTSVIVTWSDADPAAKGYLVYRATEGTNFIQIGLITSGKTTTWTDTTVSSGKRYTYEVKATAGSIVSAASVVSTVTTPLVAPTTLAATVSGTTVNLTWTDKDSAATGYKVLRSTDGTTFTLRAQLTQATASKYSDTATTAGQKYYYQVQAISSTVSSAVSNTVNVTIAAPAPSAGTVTIATRYTGELVITATGTADTVAVTQSGSILSIVADGKTTTQPVPTAGLFIYTRGGTDGVSIDQSVTVRTSIETIDGGTDTITSGGTNVSVWDDSGDIFTGTGTVHSINTFAGGVTKATGASLKDPTDSGTIMHASASLWGSGPVVGDVNQGNSGDCYFLSSLAAFAGLQPAMLQESAVDMGDGTYAVQYTNSSHQPQYVRVSNDLPTRGGGNYLYARPGSSGSIWAAIMEKAYAFFRTGANTYASIASGWMGSVYSALGVNNSFFYLSGMTEGALYNKLSADLANGKAVTFGTPSSAPNLVSGHAYTLISVSIDKNGVTSYIVRNPWGVQGDALENSQGYATLSFAQMQANFYDGCEAVS